MKRLGIAALIAFSIYGAMAGVGAILYATDNIPTGATHNDCGDLKNEIADRDYGGDEELCRRSSSSRRASLAWKDTS